VQKINAVTDDVQFRYSKHSALPRWRNLRNNPAWARRAALRILDKLRQRTENGDASWRADVNFPVDDHGC